MNMKPGAPWLGAHFMQIGEPKEVLPEVFLFSMLPSGAAMCES
jgi:hypothetical protein